MLFKKQHRNSHCLYLLLLAFFDIFVGAAYVPLMSLNVLVDYFESVFLLRAWFTYMIPMITISHVAMTSSSFLILAASIERYCLTIDFNEECQGTMNEYQMDLSSLAKNKYYNMLWRLWFKNFFTVLLPFFVLAFMNVRIVLVLQKNEFEFLAAEKISEIQRKRRVRAATRTLMMVVFTYLLSNMLNVFITIWEYIDLHMLQTEFEAFYTFGVDLVSIFTILAGALRLPIYVACQPQLRMEFFAMLKQLTRRKKYRKQLTNSSTFTYAPVIIKISQLLMKHPNPNASADENGNFDHLSPGYLYEKSVSYGAFSACEEVFL
uniref:G-protein coupled receptors family 1 profile domain-containing protein n=1 Tax=Acrobeloides nanus TaxID=290746 RepID=A0A914ECG7_9BILA